MQTKVSAGLPKNKKYDVVIVGGGLAGLSLAIQLARAHYAVIVFEKEQYPFHRVCGEYISLESWDFLNFLGVDLAALQVPVIRKLQVSAASGKLAGTCLMLHWRGWPEKQALSLKRIPG